MEGGGGGGEISQGAEMDNTTFIAGRGLQKVRHTKHVKKGGNQVQKKHKK